MKLLLVSLSILVLFSCDKRKDFYNDTNESAVANITLLNSHSPYTSTISGNHYNDTLKHGFAYKFSMDIQDEADQVLVKFNGDGNLKIDNVNHTEGDVNVGTRIFEWNPNMLEENSFDITIIDKYGIEKKYYFTIYVFENRVPEISWELVHVGNIDPLEKKIIVSGDDGDLIYGGKILYFQYIIGADTTNHPYRELNYIFPQSGAYFISVRAMDSNNEWSNEVSITDYMIN